MAKYKLLENAFIKDSLALLPSLYRAGDIVTVSDDLVPGPHMVPQDDAAEEAAARAGLVFERAPTGDQEVHNLINRYS